MKAAVYTRFGSPDVVKITDVEKPVPKDNEVLVKVRAASVNPLDWRMLRGVPPIVRMLFRLRKPTTAQPGRPGRDVAGQVEAVGSAVTQFKPGDAVFGWCQGAFAEYACALESALALKPEGVTYEQAASVPVAALTALQAIRDKGRIQPGQRILINGAAGGVGTFAVQIAKTFGAVVTAICSTRNVEMVRSLGADRVIDYTQEDFTKSGSGNAQRYDLLLDNVGNLSLRACRRALNPKGRCITAGAPKKPGLFLIRIFTAPLLSWFGSRKFYVFIAKLRREDLAVLGDLIAAGKVMPVIDKRYKLSEVPAALQYLETGHARGKVVIVPEWNN